MVLRVYWRTRQKKFTGQFTPPHPPAAEQHLHPHCCRQCEHCFYSLKYILTIWRPNWLYPLTGRSMVQSQMKSSYGNCDSSILFPGQALALSWWWVQGTFWTAISLDCTGRTWLWPNSLPNSHLVRLIVKHAQANLSERVPLHWT